MVGGCGDKHYKHTDEGPCRSGRRTRSPPSSATSVGAAAAAAAAYFLEDAEESAVRIGSEYQVEIPEFISDGRILARSESSHAMLLWAPNPEALDFKVDVYVEVARDKYGYNEEQALGMLLWHRYDVDKAFCDLPNYVPYPSEWTVEDKVLFEQGFNMHGKNFDRIRAMIPDKSVGDLVKHYYLWKKTVSHKSLLDAPGTRATDASKTDINSDGGLNMDISKSAADDMYRGNIRGSTTATSTSSSGKEESRSRLRTKCKPPKSIHLTREDLQAAMSTPSGIAPGETLVKMAESHLVALKRQVQSNKQMISTYVQRHDLDISSFRPPPNTSAINSKWTTDELLLAVQGVRRYGNDFAAIAEFLGNKTERHIQNFFLSYRRRFKLDDILREYDAEQAGRVGKCCETVDTVSDMEIDLSSHGVHPLSNSPPPLLRQATPLATHRFEPNLPPPPLQHAIRDLSVGGKSSSYQPPPPPLCRQSGPVSGTSLGVSVGTGRM